MNCNAKSIASLLSLAGIFACVLPTSATELDPNHDIDVLSNRADLISGGDALVELIVPPGIIQALRSGGNVKIQASIDGVPVPKDTFALRPNGRIMGLVKGLKVGDNTLTVQVPGKTTNIVITNHPIGGPVFAGAQLQPWICATKVAQTVTVFGNPGSTPSSATATTRASGLNDDPVDAQCDTPPTYSYYYQPKALQGTSCTFTITGASPCFVPFPSLNDPSTRPADSAIADFTNDRGDTAKSILRVERGEINRNIYELVTYYDPAVASAPWAPQKGWNQKLHWKFGAGASSSRFEESPAVNTIFDNNALRRGFMVGASHLTNNGSNTNNTLAAETLMMVKERVIENYGEIRYTMSDGCSGGSIMQNSVTSAYPGLVQGTQPNCTYQDMLSTWIEVIDASGQLLAIKECWHNLEPWPIDHPELSFEQTDDFGLNLLRGNFVASTSNILMRRSLYHKIGGMRNLRFAHDWDFLLRAASCAKCRLIPKPLLKYRVHEANTINSNRAWMLFDICWVMAANLHRFEGKQIFNSSDPEKCMQDLVTLYESINLQGNDKVFWAMRAFIQSLRHQGVENPEELLLENDDFRQKLIAYISV